MDTLARTQDRTEHDDLLDCQHALDHATRCIAAIRASVGDNTINAFDRLECVWQALRDYDGDEDE